MMDNPFSNVLQNKVEIAGRSVPVVVLGGGIGLVAALATLIARRRSGGGSDSASVPVQSVDGTAPSDQWSALTDRVNQSLAAQSASIGGQFSAFQSDITGQLSADRAATAAALAGTQSQFAASIAGLTSGQTQVQQALQTVQQDVNTLKQNYTAINQRVGTVETKAAKVDPLISVVRNMARWFYAVPNLISLGNTYSPNSSEWNTAANQAMTGIQNTVNPIGGLGTLVP